MSEVYAYGMTVLSTIHRLDGPFPAADGYEEIRETFVIPGGEAGNAAVVLSNLGVSVTLDGSYLGYATREPLLAYLQARGVNCSALQYAPDFVGWRDIVFCDGPHRSIFGWFRRDLFSERPLWSEPSAAQIEAARCVALDPFFGTASARCAEICREANRDYVTIDCPWDSPIAQHARAIVCSREFLDQRYAGEDPGALLEAYRQRCKGTVIFTFGSREILYGSPSRREAFRIEPYKVDVADTLGAGDTFRAGVVYGVLKDLDDTGIVRFAAACAAVACTRFPSVYEPPTLAEINTLIERY